LTVYVSYYTFCRVVRLCTEVRINPGQGTKSIRCQSWISTRKISIILTLLTIFNSSLCGPCTPVLKTPRLVCLNLRLVSSHSGFSLRNFSVLGPDMGLIGTVSHGNQPNYNVTLSILFPNACPCDRGHLI